MNLFIINDFRMDYGRDKHFLIANAVIDASVEMRCDIHGNVLSKLKMICEQSGTNDDDAMRKCIQKLLNHEYYPEVEINAPRCNCSASKGKIYFDFSNLSGPFRKLFEDLFTDSNWQVPKLITT